MAIPTNLFENKKYAVARLICLTITLCCATFRMCEVVGLSWKALGLQMVQKKF